MANEEGKMKLGFDLTDTKRGEQVLIEMFNKLNKGIQAVALESVNLTKKGQLISATFKAITADSREVEVQMKKTTDALLAFDKAGRLRNSLGQMTSASKEFNISSVRGLGGVGLSQSAVMQKRDLEMWSMEGQAAWAKKIAMEKQSYEKWIADGKAAWAKKTGMEKQAYERWLLEGKVAWQRKMAEEKQAYERWILEGKVAWAKKQAADRQALLQQKRDMEIYRMENAPSRFDKVFNQAAAITTGIIISQVFMRITGAMQESINTATTFQIKISEIRTLSQENQLTMEGWSKEIIGLSNAFGVDTLDVTAGLYETLSNQIAKGTEATRFMSDAMTFAAVTVTSTQNAVNLLSSGLNAYNLTTNQTNQVAASFFKLIDLGRVRADDIANSIGTVYAVSSKLGVSMNEVNAALAVMTQQGVTPNNAMTYLRNIFVSLMKPSKALKETIQEWGVASGQAAIQTFGFTGVLSKLNDVVAKGGLEELSDDLKNIRSILAGALLTGDNALDYEETLKKFEKANVSYAGATKIAFESSGKLLTQEFQKIKNLFLEGFGTKVVNAIAYVSKTIGGLANFVEITSKALISGAIAWTLYNGAMKLTSIGLSGITGLFARFITPTNLLIVTIGKLVYDLMSATNVFEDLKMTITSVESTMSTSNNAIKEKYQKLGESVQKSLNDSFTPIFQKMADTRAKLTEMAEHAQDKFKEVNDSIKDSTDAFVDAITEHIKELKSEITQLNQIARDSEKYSRNFVKKRNDNMFEDSIEDLSNPQKAQSEYVRAESRFTSAKQLFEEAKKLMTVGSVELANEAFRDARAMLEEALTLADRAQKNNIKGSKEYAKELADVEKDIEQTKKKIASQAERLDDMLKFSKNTPRNVDSYKDLKEQFKATQQELANLEAQKAKLIEGDPKAKLKDQEVKILERQREIEEGILAAEREMSLIVKERAAQRELEVQALEASKKKTKELFTDALKIEFKDKDTQEQKVKKLEEYKRLRQEIDGALGGTGINFGNELEITMKLLEKEQILQRELDLKEQIKAVDDERAKAEKEREERSKQIEKVTNKNLTTADTFNKQVVNVVAAIEKMNELAPVSLISREKAPIFDSLAGNLTALKSDNIKSRMSALQTVLPLLDAGSKIFEKMGEALPKTKYTEIGLLSTQAGIEARQALGQYETMKANEKELEALKTVHAQTYSDMTNTVQSNNATQIKLTEQMVDRMIQEHQRYRDAVNNMGMTPPTAPEGYAFGGFARGLDTIPAMLSPGEFVVNAGATRRFYSQLVAMNNGGARHMASGGYVSNHTFGDINVSVEGGKNATVTARDIGLALRRELRRGTLPPL